MSAQSTKTPQQLVLLLWIMIMCLSTVHCINTLHSKKCQLRFSYFLHPQPIFHDLDAVHFMSKEIQTMINEERQYRGLSTTDSNHITKDNSFHYDATMRAVQDEWVYCLKLQLNSLHKGLNFLLTIMSIVGYYKWMKYLLRVKALMKALMDYQKLSIPPRETIIHKHTINHLITTIIPVTHPPQTIYIPCQKLST